jgi:hypothetical protein
MTAATFTEAVQAQTTIMLNIAKRLDERGYAVIFHDQKLETQLCHGIVTIANEVGGKRRRRPVIVEVRINWPARKTALKDGSWLTQPISVPFTFRCRVNSTKAYAPIHAALSMMCVERPRRWVQASDTIIEKYPMSTMVEYTGRGKNLLEIMIRVLDMPQHRAILTGRA